MSGKPASRKTAKKEPKKKITLTGMIIIILTVLFSLVFIVFTTYNPGRKKSSPRTATSVPKSGIPFRTDGSLKFYRSQNPAPLLIDIEVADEEQERIRGLMDRYSLPENAGMLFIFEKEEPRSFWMKDTYISLDIIYINAALEIVSIQKDTQPQTTSSIPSDQPAMYVLEVNAGFTDRLGIVAGDKIAFEIAVR